MPNLFRPPWNRFPDVVIVAGVPEVQGHPQYEQAKAGNVQEAAAAAKRLSAAFVSYATVDRVKSAFPTSDATLVPVHAMEGGGFNRIPGAFAELLGEKLACEVDIGIVQANIVNHTGASGWARMARPPLFSGDVTSGRDYVLVDDFIGQGGTLANLRGHIVAGGGLVVGAITLTGKAYSAKLALDFETLRQLREKHGREIEAWWRENFGHDFKGLTESEARYLIRAENAHTIRAKLAEAGFTGDR